MFFSSSSFDFVSIVVLCLEANSWAILFKHCSFNNFTSCTVKHLKIKVKWKYKTLLKYHLSYVGILNIKIQLYNEQYMELTYRVVILYVAIYLTPKWCVQKALTWCKW